MTSGTPSAVPGPAATNVTEGARVIASTPSASGSRNLRLSHRHPAGHEGVRLRRRCRDDPRELLLLRARVGDPSHRSPYPGVVAGVPLFSLRKSKGGAYRRRHMSTAIQSVDFTPRERY